MSSLRGVVEISNILEQHYGEYIPKNWYLITDCGGDQRVDFLSVQKVLIVLFLKHDKMRL